SMQISARSMTSSLPWIRCATLARIAARVWAWRARSPSSCLLVAIAASTEAEYIRRRNWGHPRGSVQLPAEHDAVADRQQHLLDARTRADVRVEAHDRVVVVGLWVDDLAAPQRVVGEQHSADREHLEREIEVADVAGLVGVDE